MSVDDLGSTGDALMSVFHALSMGNGRRPSSEAPPAVGFEVDVPGSVAAGSLAALHARTAAARQQVTVVVVRMDQHGASGLRTAVPLVTFPG
jgi:hypothetical protein